MDLTKFLLKHNFKLQFCLKDESEVFFSTLQNLNFNLITELVTSYDLKYTEYFSELSVSFLYPREQERADLLKIVFFNSNKFNVLIHLKDPKGNYTSSTYKLNLTELTEFVMSGNDRAHELLETSVKFRCILMDLIKS